ncbi:MAG: metal-dependent transcriptional regulator [Desulfobacterales bacterium]|uniref:Transcriptional regulator MntR n=1 Tax=Candidatus Desulfatibia profunda TaxID=2841695 RepID=A0A8J6NVZ1_9BACT|nr:metal-dependent transcriptional regulator [Candidatus Desulfatibia profunda]MBL7178776.1 metal-dependent transcriptional regulator [Desulfobacterales bacterium]
MEKDTELSESLEDYLEVILELEQDHKVARAKDIADKMGFQRGSVTGALKSLKEKGLINYTPYSFITLTAKGAKIAKEITRRHNVLKDFLLNVLQINADKAETIACRMEHAIDKAAIDRLVCFIEYLYKCPRTGEDWIKSFLNYCATGGLDQDKCDQCVDACKTFYRSNGG